ncbi:MAG: TfuA-like protein [Caulobacteraceae bacterium]
MTADLRGRIVVFAGPSLPPARRPNDPRFAWAPPAVAGDALALLDAAPRAVILIDGLFDEWPAIRHKELLALISRGVPLIGGASMGALRAAELSSHGMIGVGAIFAAYASGRLDGDDEVAVVHGPAEWDWAPLTEPLVNVRATILAAVRGRVVDVAAGRDILLHASRMFYKERTWPSLLSAVIKSHGPGDRALNAFENWLPSGRIDLKQMDALACLDEALLARSRTSRPSAPETLFTIALQQEIARRDHRRAKVARAAPRKRSSISLS